MQDFFPLSELAEVPRQTSDEILERVFAGTFPDYTCALSKDWRFDEIERDATRRVGHEFEGRKHGSIAEIVLKALYDLERSLRVFHPKLSCDAVAAFWTSWEVQHHIAIFCHRVERSDTARKLSRDPQKDAGDACNLMYVQLAVYAHEITIANATIIPSVENRSVEQPGNRNGEIDVFLQACNALSMVRIRKRHIWLSVGHSKARQFEYWQAGDEKATRVDNANFRRILGMKPEDFVALLQRKKLIPGGM